MKGWMSFFFEKRIMCGFLREERSVRRMVRRELLRVPRRRSVVLGFSWARGAWDFRIRDERADFGFLRGEG